MFAPPSSLAGTGCAILDELSCTYPTSRGIRKFFHHTCFISKCQPLVANGYKVKTPIPYTHLGPYPISLKGTDQVSRIYYDTKRAEGMKHNKAVIALARRRGNVLIAMLRDETLYKAHKALRQPLSNRAIAPQSGSEHAPDGENARQHIGSKLLQGFPRRPRKRLAKRSKHPTVEIMIFGSSSSIEHLSQMKFQG